MRACMRETDARGGIIELLVMDVKGLKLDVIRTTKLTMYFTWTQWRGKTGQRDFGWFVILKSG